MKPDRFGAHLPWREKESLLSQILDLGLKPEIAIKGPELDRVDPERLGRLKQSLAAVRVRPTVHAPFFDLNPGALDPRVRDITFERLSASLDLAGQLNADLMVVHPGYDKWRYPNLAETWGDLAAEFFPPLLDQAQACDCRLALENIYEETPDTLVRLVDALNSPWFGHCFDTGHWQLFGRTDMATWLAAVGPRLLHLHLHDNHGRADDHLPVGAGLIDFSPLRHFLTTITSVPSMTLEAHSLEHLKRSLRQVTSWFAST